MTVRDQIRPIRAQDGAALREVRLAALADAPEAFQARLEDEAARPEQEWAAMATLHAASADTTTFLLWQNSRPVGMIGAFFDQGRRDRAYICAMWVAPALRRGGAGGRLVDTAARWLAERGASRVLAWVADSNIGALRFYESLGFVDTKERGEIRPGQGETLLAFDVAIIAGVTQVLCPLESRPQLEETSTS
ncbi:GNAT family N-acetyltransferase [Chitinimonas lacunae]|uniref:GNAT family N-acetyltransferase n=1 Tax=Chitinimonas lacunae TaxID=1963018 RepID=A0ABV8MXR7_9NEIS